ncbi:MAG: L,D-transpeptidase [Gammaproteobacteria bacterium]|nr:L,D-transpeptidase [Gammaproteobacteria bacterium]MCW5582769.1 L,D-transpeptidase [Gammaproteobacteria bacterium]
MQNISYSVIYRALLIFFISPCLYAQAYEISGSPFATEGAPLPEYIENYGEKVIVVYPMDHLWGAYNQTGKLIRWGIATAGAEQCEDSENSCRTKTGSFRIYSLGNSSCVSNKYAGSPMPYCMYFNGGQALHGSSDIQFDNVSHGCVRVHVNDAKWLRYHFVEGPNITNHYRGTKIIVKPYS